MSAARGRGEQTGYPDHKLIDFEGIVTLSLRTALDSPYAVGDKWRVRIHRGTVSDKVYSFEVLARK